ncbi:MAG TPA: hypothetical protein PL033_07005 [Candidatus Brocadiia bacterium]|nr:hypothetical protein [Candidatus Brocadiia bacterium]
MKKPFSMSILFATATLVVTLISGTLKAETKVSDSWNADGNVKIEGAGWTAIIARGASDIQFQRGNQSVKIAFLPDGKSDPLPISSCKAAAAADGKQVETMLSLEGGGKTGSLKLFLAGNGDARIAPGEGVATLMVKCPIEVGLLPGILLESVAYLPGDFAGRSEICVPSEGWFAGLAKGRNAIAALAWPRGKQRLSLTLEGSGEERAFSAMRLDLDGREAFFGLLCVEGIWHRERPKPNYLEKNVKLDWKRPFDAEWRTELPIKAETTAPRTFEFSSSRQSPWRPEIGAYVWPVWFDKGDAYMHLSKRIPPTNDVVIYPISGHDNSLAGFINRTPMGGELSAANERRPHPLGPRNAPNVGFNACWGTFLMRRSVYAAGAQAREKEFLREHAEFLADYVAIIQIRNRGYFDFIERMKKKIPELKTTAGANPAAGEFLDVMMKRVAELEIGHREKMILFGEDTPEQHIARADRYEKRLKELLETPGREVFPECWNLVDSFNRMSWGHDESTGMRFNMLARGWAQECARLCADKPDAVVLATDIRGDILDALRSAAPW